MELKQFKISILPLRDRLIGYAQKLTENSADAEDVVQETLLKLWNMRDKLEEYNSVEALAMRMTHNLCMDLWRKRKPEFLSQDLIITKAETYTPEKLLEQQDEIALMESIIASLPPLQQTIIRMKDIQGYETDEIAGITGCANEAIRSNLSRARKKVREIYLQAIKEKRRSVI